MGGWKREHDLARHRPALGRPRPRTSAAPRRRSPTPGPCLLEATNASEGRGTEAPFLLVGAPWMKAEAVAREAATPGLRAGADRLHARGLRGGAEAEAPRGSLPGCSRAGDGPRRRAAVGPRAEAADRPAPAPGVRVGARGGLARHAVRNEGGARGARAWRRRGGDPRRRSAGASSAGAASGPRLCCTRAPRKAPVKAGPTAVAPATRGSPAGRSRASTSEPTSVYHGQASFVPKATAVMVARPSSRPANAARGPTRRVKIPRKKTPRMMPVVKPAIVEHGLDHRAAEQRPAEGDARSGRGRRRG